MIEVGRMLKSNNNWFALQLTKNIVFRWLPDITWSVYDEVDYDLLSDWNGMPGYWDVNG